jgi:hypothetical protein
MSGLSSTRNAPATQNDLSKFDPEGSGYDYNTATAWGMGPTGTGEDAGHWGSVAPAPESYARKYNLPDGSYMILKGATHPTFFKAVAAEKARGSVIKKYGDRYFSVPNR